MQHAEPGRTWAEWLEENDGADDEIKLAALREYIVQEARTHVAYGEITPEWANKKLATLGITEQVAATNTYLLQAPVTGTVEISLRAADRTEAEKVFRDSLNGASDRSYVASALTITGDVTFVSGPYDPDPANPAPDTPATVADTLAKLREVIMLGVVAGPKVCEYGANRVLASFGLAPVPSRKQFVVSRPAQVVMQTTVEAYDQDSADRVAGWRWDDGHKGYSVTEALANGPVVIADN
jgi:hypothetical protein